MPKTRWLLALAFPIAVLALTPLSIPVRSTILSNGSILQASWINGYCGDPTGPRSVCPAIVTDNGTGYVALVANSTASTFLMQFPFSYSNILSHEVLTYHFQAIAPIPTNLTLKFSEVVNSNYYSGEILTADQKGRTSYDGSLDVSGLNKALGSIRTSPVRLQIDSSPPTSELLIGLEIEATDSVAIGNVVGSNIYAVAGLLLLGAVYYRPLRSPTRLRWISRGLFLSGLGVLSQSLANGIFGVWPPLDMTFALIFTFGLVFGSALLWLYIPSHGETN